VVLNIVLFGLVVYGSVAAFLYFVQEKILFHPQQLPGDYQFEFETEFGFEEIFLNAADGSRLHSLLFGQQNPKGIILYFHGNAGSLAGWGTVAYDLLPYGYEVLITDYRGYGKSTGKMSEVNFFSDAQLWYEFCRSRFPESQIVIYGRSLGTGVATQVAAQNKPSRVLLETPFFNMADLAKGHFPGFPHQQLIRYPFRNDKYILEIQSPVFIIHGTADEVVPYESGKRLGALGDGSWLRFRTIPGGNHNNLSNYPEYISFLNEAFN